MPTQPSKLRDPWATIRLPPVFGVPGPALNIPAPPQNVQDALTRNVMSGLNGPLGPLGAAMGVGATPYTMAADYITRGGQAPPAPAPAPGYNPAWSFATPGGMVPGAARPDPNAPAGRPIDPVIAFATRLGATVTSGDRTRAYQEDMKRRGYTPSDNSFHLQPGHAVDLVPPKGVSTTAFKQQLATSGIPMAELLDEGDHVHVAVGKGPFDYPALATMDPRMAGSFPMPTAPKHLDLPDAPHMGALPERPAEEVPDTAKWMAELRALAPKAFDEKAARKGRITQVIAGIAAGAANTDARRGVGAMLAAMGAGGEAALANWQEVTQERRDRASEASRLFELGLVRQGIDFSQMEGGARQRNADRKWQDGVDKTRTQFDNSLRDYQTKAQEIVANNNLDNGFLGAVDAAHQSRWRAGMQIMEANIAATNQQLTGQAELDLRRFMWQDQEGRQPLSQDQARTVGQMAQGLGLNPALIAAQKDARGFNALTGLGYMAAQNKPAAITALGRELVLSGRFDLITDKKVQAEIARAAKVDPELAAARVGELLNAEEASAPGSVLGLAKLMAVGGAPLASAFVKFAPTPPVPAAPAPARGK